MKTEDPLKRPIPAQSSPEPSIPEPSIKDRQIRDLLDLHWRASAAGDANAEHDIYEDDAICDYPQSGERILGRNNLQALRSHHPGKPSGFAVKRIAGRGDLWVTEYTILYQGRPAYTVSIMEFRNGKVVHETQYFADPFRPRPGGVNGFKRSPDQLRRRVESVTQLFRINRISLRFPTNKKGALQLP